MVKCRKWVLRSHFSGLPKREDLKIVEEELPPLKDGDEQRVLICSVASLDDEEAHAVSLVAPPLHKGN
jgi:hypothetical protein